MTTAMEQRLERYERVQDAEYDTYLSERMDAFQAQSLGFWREQRILMMREISAIEKHLAGDECDEIVTPSAWHERLVDCRAQLVIIEGRLEELGVAN